MDVSISEQLNLKDPKLYSMDMDYKFGLTEVNIKVTGNTDYKMERVKKLTKTKDLHILEIGRME